MNRILLDVTLEVFPGVVAEAPRKFCITFIFPKMNSQVKLWLNTRITAEEFMFAILEFTGSCFSKLFMNNKE